MNRAKYVYPFLAAGCSGCYERLMLFLDSQPLLSKKIELTENAENADIIIVLGLINDSNRSALASIRAICPKPLKVIYFGVCAASGAVFQDRRSITFDSVHCINACPPVDSLISGFFKTL